eukprot:scaffold30683_cov43-Phaeocystis_antarctica.AAC.1
MCPGRDSKLWSGSVFSNMKPKCRDSSATGECLTRRGGRGDRPPAPRGRARGVGRAGVRARGREMSG